ncbi:urea ABC transporter ATP-binding subunit UrtE [Anaerostipes sp. MSJ-23]|uniref:urea ABC transporter ATP-binding subunit UrtE n=1 Tax=unclassified Anaerostipes TaxID=2635253 RepID=UPI001C11CE6C|nr:urea ABC transporter ATP-binding subunit UrtE [Anaerostipes sp. MSJ-23]MBU5460368.1 urea ABC transporter ATP-binding subunit UrtE [Anaerostipes sp. MSJ-23]
MLTLSNVDACYGESRILRKLSMEVPKGKIVSLIGRNGVGKSTTLRSIMGLIKTPEGSIKMDGEELIQMPTYKRVRNGIGYVPQGRDIFPQMTVEENLELGLQPLGGKGKIPDYIYDLFPILPQFAKRKGGALSGGQQQQLAIARALVAEPKILILDEPTEGIQPSIIKDIGVAIKKINEWKGITILMVEQYLDFVLEHTDYLNVMEKGEIVYRKETKKADAAEVQKLMTE